MADAAPQQQEQKPAPAPIRQMQANQGRQTQVRRLIGRDVKLGQLPVYFCGLCPNHQPLDRVGNVDGLETYHCPACNRIWQEAPTLYHDGHQTTGLVVPLFAGEPIAAAEGKPEDNGQAKAKGKAKPKGGGQ